MPPDFLGEQMRGLTLRHIQPDIRTGALVGLS